MAPLDWAPGLDWRRVTVRTVGLALPNDATELQKVKRIAGIANRIVDFAVANEVGHVWLEGYAFSKLSSRAHALGELGGAVKLRLFDAGIPFDVVTASAARKHFGTFPAKGAKDACHEVLRSLGAPVDWTGDELDAFVIVNHGLIEGGHQGIVVPEVPKKKRKAAA